MMVSGCHLIAGHQPRVQTELPQGPESVVDSHNDEVIIYQELGPVHVTWGLMRWKFYDDIEFIPWPVESPPP